MPAHSDIKRHVIPAFYTPLLRVRIPGAEKFNPALRDSILKREVRDESLERSNAGGWHSRDDFFRWTDPGAQELAKAVQNYMMGMISFVSRAERFKSKVEFTGWANVNRSGDYNHLHNHPEHHWSGVYYVDAGAFENERHKYAGYLIVEDPRGSAANMYRHPGKCEWGVPLRFKPEDGVLILFPSWVNHSVAPFQSDTVRISVAVNAKINEFDDVSDQNQ